MRFQGCRQRLSLGLLGILLFQCATAQKRDAVAVKEFQNRIDNYLSAKKKQDIAKKPTDSPGKLAQEKQQTAEKTQAARPCGGRTARKSAPACAMPSRCRTCS
jgi:hypothetical protein